MQSDIRLHLSRSQRSRLCPSAFVSDLFCGSVTFLYHVLVFIWYDLFMKIIVSMIDDSPNQRTAVAALWKKSGLSARVLSREIEVLTGVYVHASAIRRTAARGNGIGRQGLRAIAQYFNVRLFDLYDPALVDRL